MRDLPPGWATDLAVLELSGSTVEDRGDHLVIRTPQNPEFHWGNALFVTDEEGLDDPARWVRTFQSAFPRAPWVALGLTGMPDDRSPWVAQRLDLEQEDVLTTLDMPRQSPLPTGYVVRRLSGRDWDQSVARSIAENDRTREQDPRSWDRFTRRQVAARRALSEQGLGATFGAFADGALIADLGIVRCGTTARYQSVSTEWEHRRRGLASHLLGVAARWSARHDCDRWVIVTEDANPAGLLYRGAGFQPDIGTAQAYRKPAPPAPGM